MESRRPTLSYISQDALLVFPFYRGCFFALNYLRREQNGVITGGTYHSSRYLYTFTFPTLI